MYYTNEDKDKLCKMIRPEEVKLPRERVFFGHWNIPHVVGGSKDNHVWRSHLYLVPENIHLKDAVAFPYEDSMQPEMRKKHNVLLCCVDSLYMSYEKKVAYDNVYRNTICVTMTREGDENRAMCVWPDYALRR